MFLEMTGNIQIRSGSGPYIILEATIHLLSSFSYPDRAVFPHEQEGGCYEYS